MSKSISAIVVTLVVLAGCSVESQGHAPDSTVVAVPKPVPNAIATHLAAAQCTGGADITPNNSMPTEWSYSMTVTKVPSDGRPGTAMYCVDVANSAGGPECKVDDFSDDAVKEGEFQQWFAGQPFTVYFNAQEQDVRTETAINPTVPNPCQLTYR